LSFFYVGFIQKIAFAKLQKAIDNISISTDRLTNWYDFSSNKHLYISIVLL